MQIRGVAKKLTLFKPGGRIMPLTLLPALPRIQKAIYISGYILIFNNLSLFCVDFLNCPTMYMMYSLQMPKIYKIGLQEQDGLKKEPVLFYLLKIIFCMTYEEIL